MPSPEQNNCVQSASTDDTFHTARIRALNDQFRRTMVGGRIMLTSGVHALGVDAVADTVACVAGFDAFSAGNDPYAEHDFGSIEVLGQRIFWKIDYHDRWLTSGSPDPADPSVTTRVLTIMLAAEY